MQDQGMPTAKHDFNNPIQKTSSEIAKVILGLMVKYQDSLFAPALTGKTKEEEQKDYEEYRKFATEAMKHIAISDLPTDYAAYSIVRIEGILTMLKTHIMSEINQRKDELMGLVLGSKSPENNKYRAEVATVGELLLAVNKMREEKGTTIDDYNPEVVQPEEISTEKKEKTGENLAEENPA